MPSATTGLLSPHPETETQIREGQLMGGIAEGRKVGFSFFFFSIARWEGGQIRMRSGPSYTPPPSGRDICLDWREPTTERSSPQATVCPWHLSPTPQSPLCIEAGCAGTTVHSSWKWWESFREHVVSRVSELMAPNIPHPAAAAALTL